MKIVITGSKGMLGCDLSRRLGKGYDVVGIDIEDVDIAAESAKSFIYSIKPGFIFHLAAYTQVDKAETDTELAYKVNVKGTENIVSVCEELNIPLVFVSTDYVFDGAKEVPYSEKDSPNPINFYGKTKWEAEELIKNRLSKFFIVRSSWLFGKNGKNFVRTILSLSEKNERIEVVDDQRGSPTYTQDLAVSLTYFLDCSEYGIYHVTNAGSCSWCEFAKAIIFFSERCMDIIPVKTKMMQRQVRRPKNSVLDNSLFIQRFNLKMPEWEDALKRYLAEERKLHTEDNPGGKHKDNCCSGKIYRERGVRIGLQERYKKRD